jgi:glycine/D-amino acid oxidase-like deaminating enzyme
MAKPLTAIIGAGIVGCLIARELARDPDREVIVIDRDEIGSGASRRSAGLHLPRGATPRIRRMSAYSHAYYRALLRECPDLPIHPVGATVVTGPGTGRPDGYLDEAGPVPVDPSALAAVATGTPPPREPAPAGQVPSRLAPAQLALPAGARAWRLAGCHYADVHELATTLAAGLRPRVRFAEGVAVTGLTGPGLHGPGPVTVELSTGDRLVADTVVLAPGPWLDTPAWRGLLEPLGLRVKKIAALHLERRPQPGDKAVVFDDDDSFLLPLPGRGHWLFSYTCQEWDVDPDDLTGALSAAQLNAARACLRRHSPALADTCRAGRVFCDAYSPAREPVVRALDDHGSIVFAGAAGGSGYRLAPAIGAAVAELLRTRRSGGVTGDHQYV